MGRKLLLVFALMFFVAAFSSCVQHVPHGTPYHVWHGHRVHRHYGINRHQSFRHNFWGRNHYGPRPHRHRGAYHY
jgi:hypothetical protein